MTKYTINSIPDNAEVVENIASRIIVISEDKAHLVLIEHQKELHQGTNWLGAAGLVSAFVITFATTDFKDFVLSKHTWQAIFVLLTAASTIWLIAELRSVFKRKKHRSIEHVLKALSKAADNPAGSREVKNK